MSSDLHPSIVDAEVNARMRDIIQAALVEGENASRDRAAAWRTDLNIRVFRRVCEEVYGLKPVAPAAADHSGDNEMVPPAPPAEAKAGEKWTIETIPAREGGIRHTVWMCSKGNSVFHTSDLPDAIDRIAADAHAQGRREGMEQAIAAVNSVPTGAYQYEGYFAKGSVIDAIRAAKGAK